MERERVWIDPRYADDPFIRAATEFYHPAAEIFPRKRPAGTDEKLRHMRAAAELRTS